MYLAHAELIGVAPFGHITFPFRNADGDPRMVTVVQGAGGVGKTALLQILACTRPGHATVLMGRNMPEAKAPAHAMCEWVLDDDDDQRPHPLIVMTPNVPPRNDDEANVLRRREQALFDRRAKERGGDPELGERMVMNYRTADLSPRQRRMLDFAVLLTRASASVEEADREALREVGFSDRDIWDIASVAGFFNMSNRMASATDMRPNKEYHGRNR